MELLYNYLLLTFLLLLLMIINPKNGSETQNKVYRALPEPWKLPIIGSVHHHLGKLTMHFETSQKPRASHAPKAR